MPPTDLMNMPAGAQFERTAFDTLNRDRSLYAPLDIVSVKAGKRRESSPGGMVRLAWQGREVEFQAEVKSRTAPKIVREAFWKLRDQPTALREKFLLIVPFITDSIREMVEKERVSCIDMSGNYYILNPKLLAVRLDRKNRFPESAPIKKIFSGNSSQVGRLFLAEKRVFGSVNEISAAIRSQGLPLSLSTISKVLAGLAEELIIEKGPERIALLQAEKLLDRLQADYVPPKPLATLKLKVPGNTEDVLNALGTMLSKSFCMLSGESSASRYSTTTAPSVFRVYSYQAGDLDKYNVEESRFFNVVLDAIDAPYVYFDRKVPDKGLPWASPLQAYLELSRMDKREQEIAESIREGILKGLK